MSQNVTKSHTFSNLWYKATFTFYVWIWLGLGTTLRAQRAFTWAQQACCPSPSCLLDSASHPRPCDRIISAQHCPCAVQIPDVRTKAFPPIPFEYFKDQLPATNTLAADDYSSGPSLACLSVQITWIKLLSVPIPTPNSVEKNEPLVIRKSHNSNHSHIDKPRKACAPNCKYIQSNIRGVVDNLNLGNLRDKT